MIPPSLEERIGWYQAAMRPDDPKMGNGLADWTITAEYQDAPQIDGKDVWGCLCSPEAMPVFRPLSAADIAAKRAHLVFRTPRTTEDLAQLERTILHELGHVLLVGAKTMDTQGEENAMHSMDALFAKLTPAQGRILARAMVDSSARLVAQGDTMADPTQKPADTMPAGEVKKQEGAGAPRDIAAIQADMAKADPTDAALLGKLAVELREALIAKGIEAQGGGNGPASVPPPPPPTMGMDPNASPYAREIATANKEAIEAMIEANTHLTDPQKAVVRKQPTAALAREMIATYPRPASSPSMGFSAHPSTEKGGGKPLGPLAREMKAAETDAVFCRAMGIGTAENTGVSYDTPGCIVYVDGSERLRHQREMYRQHRERRAA